MSLQIGFRVQLVKELSLGSPALWLDWTRNAEPGEIVVGVATREGKFFTLDPETWAQKDMVELDPPTPIWRVVGNHHATPADCDFALATLNAGVIGIKSGKGVMWQHPFGSSCGAIAFARHGTDGKQLIIAGGLDKTIRGMDPATGKLMWGQVFLEGVGFVDVFDVGQETLAVAGDAAGNVRCFDAFSGTLRWHGEFGQNARFCVPIPIASGEAPLWVVGTDEKQVRLFEVTTKGSCTPLFSIPTAEFPWQARTISKTTTVVSIYDFANLGESTAATPGELIALSNTGQEQWKATLAGSAEDFDVISGDPEAGSPIFVASNAGVVACVDPRNGTVISTLSLGESPVNCIKFLPVSGPPEYTLVIACDDGRVILIKEDALVNPHPTRKNANT